MIRPIVALLALLVALLVALAGAGTAAAQAERPTLRASVVIGSDVVRIGDLIENAGPLGDIPIFRAPDLGTTGAVSAQRVLEAVRAHQLLDVDTRGLTEVIVTRLSRTIAVADIDASIAQQLSAQFGLGEPRNIQITFDRAVRALQVEPDAGGELRVISLSYDPRTNRFDATLDLLSSLQLHRQPPRFTGTAIETLELVAVNRPVEHGEILQSSDLTTLRRPKGQAGALTDMAAVVGMAARHQLRPGQPLYAADLMKPEIVQRNDTVTLVYEAPGLTLTLRGQAQEPGALGDTIGVLNSQTKRVVQGVIAGPGRVTVNAGATHLVASAPEPEPAAPPPGRAFVPPKRVE